MKYPVSVIIDVGSNGCLSSQRYIHNKENYVPNYQHQVDDNTRMLASQFVVRNSFIKKSTGLPSIIKTKYL